MKHALALSALLLATPAMAIDDYLKEAALVSVETFTCNKYKTNDKFNAAVSEAAISMDAKFSEAMSMAIGAGAVYSDFLVSAGKLQEFCAGTRQ